MPREDTTVRRSCGDVDPRAWPAAVEPMRVIPEPERHPLLRRAKQAAHPQPPEHGVLGRRTRHIAPSPLSPLDAPEQPEEEEQVANADAPTVEVRRGWTRLTEPRPPSRPPRERRTLQIRVEMHTITQAPAPPRQIADELAHGQVPRAEIAVSHRRAIIWNRQRDHAPVRENWTWNAPGAPIESLAAQDQIHIPDPCCLTNAFQRRPAPARRVLLNCRRRDGAVPPAANASWAAAG